MPKTIPSFSYTMSPRLKSFGRSFLRRQNWRCRGLLCRRSAGSAGWPSLTWLVWICAASAGLAQAGVSTQDGGSTETGSAEGSPVLASYDFEESVDSGPDTFWVRASRGSEVALSSAFRWGGVRSLHITEVAGNRDFAEFLAYFPERREGSVFIQFYLLLTDESHHFNFGLAGNAWFLRRERHGQAVWLQSGGGRLRHQTASGWEDLAAHRLFTWYFVDLVYRPESGTYDVALYEEGADEPVVDLRGVAAMHGQAESSVRYASLIGDLEDTGKFDYFVDDLLIASDPAVLQSPFVAPGRRRTFVDSLAIATPQTSALSPDRVEEQILWALTASADMTSLADDEQLEVEHAGDLAFRTGDLIAAQRLYEAVAELPSQRVRALLKLADVAHLAGDTATERRLRESIYGRLSLEDDP